MRIEKGENIFTDDMSIYKETHVNYKFLEFF